MSFRIIRNYQNKPSRTIEARVTLKEARAHCGDPETSSKTCTKSYPKSLTKKHGPWFDCYDEN